MRFSGYESPKRIPVVMAKGSHLFPYRTQKLSLSAPMVLGWRRPGRVGHCRIPNKKHTTNVVCFLFVPGQRLLSRCVPVKYVSTWLGCPMTVPSGHRHGATPGSASCKAAFSLRQMSGAFLLYRKLRKSKKRDKLNDENRTA